MPQSNQEFCVSVKWIPEAEEHTCEATIRSSGYCNAHSLGVTTARALNIAIRWDVEGGVRAFVTGLLEVWLPKYTCSHNYLDLKMELELVKE